MLLLTSNGVVSTGGVGTVSLAASEWAEAETSAGSIGWPLSLVMADARWHCSLLDRAIPKKAIFSWLSRYPPSLNKGDQGDQGKTRSAPEHQGVSK